MLSHQLRLIFFRCSETTNHVAHVHLEEDTLVLKRLIQRQITDFKSQLNRARGASCKSGGVLGSFGDDSSKSGRCKSEVLDVPASSPKCGVDIGTIHHQRCRRPSLNGARHCVLPPDDVLPCVTEGFVNDGCDQLFGQVQETERLRDS